MKCFVLGDGMLGTYVFKYLGSRFDVIQISRSDLDFCSEEFEIKKFFGSINLEKNDVIINCVGIIKHRGGSIIDMIKINSVFPHILQDIASSSQSTLIHISTDCVYNGIDGFYTESHHHNCLDPYGKTKSLGENPETCIIRTSIIGEEINNKLSLLEWVFSKVGHEIDGYVNHIWNGVTCLQLSKIVEEMIDKKIFWKGVRHIFSEDVSKYELIKIIVDVYNLDSRVIPIEAQKCFRNLRSDHSNQFLIPDIKSQISEQKNFKIK